MRCKSNILFTRGHFKVLVDGRVQGAKRKRTYIPSPVSLGFPGFTLTLTLSLDCTKLAPMLIEVTGRDSKVHLPTREQILRELGSPVDLTFPEVPILLCNSKSSFDKSRIHSEQSSHCHLAQSLSDAQLLTILLLLFL